MRKNNFSTIDKESSGAAQKTLLKEEFYRTFIMIAGRIPFWAVLPAGIDDREYERWTTIASTISAENYTPSDYIDLGNLPSISGNECLGALLWQTYKARNDPVKSLIKGALIANYYFFGSNERLLCDEVKQGYSKRQLDSYLLDPYTIVFEKVIKFFESINDKEGLDLVKECIILRLLGYPFAMELSASSPKQELLNRLVQKWHWNERQLQPLKSYKQWPESKKLAYDGKIVNKLTYLYELVLLSKDKRDKPFDMPLSDIRMLTNHISVWFQKKPNKIPKCSTYIRARSNDLLLTIACEPDTQHRHVWKVYATVAEEKEPMSVLFIDSSLSRVVGWIVSQNLHGLKEAHIRFQQNATGLSLIKAKRFMRNAMEFFSATPSLPSKDPKWHQMMVALNGIAANDYKTIESAELLIKNTLGEIYFQPVNLSHIEKNLLKCYEVSLIMWRYIKTVPLFALMYRVEMLYVNTSYHAQKTIEDIIGKFRKKTISLDHKVSGRQPLLRADKLNRLYQNRSAGI
ncbi:MAG: class I adenylate cyclase [Deltaproteobacteria bacterium]|nr:class I adenylate cyclase [Deltaproteobacteria bacterium]